MSLYTSTTPSFASTAVPTFHATSTKRGCNAMNDDTSFPVQDAPRSNKRIKISSPEQTSFYGTSYQPQPFQAPIQFDIPSGPPSFTYGGESSQTNKRQRA